jgi:hypothetical protein
MHVHARGRARLAAWAGLASAAARKGNPDLRSAMVEAAWACSRTASAQS